MAIEIVRFPIKNGDFPWLCKRLPKGREIFHQPKGELVGDNFNGGNDGEPPQLRAPSYPNQRLLKKRNACNVENVTDCHMD